MKRTTAYLLLICLVSAMGGLLFGYDWVVIGGAKIFYEPFFGLEGSAALRGWAMSSALIGCLTGALLSGEWSDKYGRKKMLIIASFLFVWSAYGTGAVDSFTWFIIYRIIGGFECFAGIYCRGRSGFCPGKIRFPESADNRFRYPDGAVGKLADW